jgi:hypothetical protein
MKYKGILFALLMVAGCTETKKPHEDMFFAILDHLLSEYRTADGNWAEDFGDGSFYGQAFLIPWGVEKDRAEYVELGFLTTGFVNDLINRWKDEPLLYLDVGDDILMGNLGIYSAYENYDAACQLLLEKGGGCTLRKDRLRENIDWSVARWNETIASFDNYVPDMDIYAIYTYGNTVVTALFAVLNQEYARVVGGAAAQSHLETAELIVDVIHEKVWDEGLQAYRYKPAVAKLHLYPNIIMMVLYGRLYRLTGEQTYLQRSRLLFDSIQPLKDEEKGGYHSPYSMETMGAKTDDYMTLSSSCYTTLAMMTLYENTGDKKYLDEAGEVLDFVENHLYKDGMALHHWMDGEMAKPEHLEYYCTGCNLQLLFTIQYYWNLL